MLELVRAVALLTVMAANPDLEKAEKQYEAFKYADAEKTLTVALARQGNDRATLIRIYELRGIVQATLGKKTALDDFNRLVAIDPDHILSRDLGPRILQPFYEARARLAENPALKLELEATVAPNQQGVLKVVARNDSMKLAAKVKLFWRMPGAAWQWRVEPSTPAGFEQIVDGDTVEYWAQVLSPKDAVLIEVASAEKPLRAEPPPPEPQPETVVVVKEVEAASRPLSGARKAAIAVAAVGVATMGGAIAAGVVSSSARRQIESPQRDENGKPIGVPPERVKQLQDQTVAAAIASNVLWGCGIALAAAGVVVFIANPGGGAAEIAIAPAPGGVAIAGSF